MRKTMLALAALVMAIPAVTRAQAADLRPAVAVLPFDNGSIDPTLGPLSKGFQAMLLNQLAMNSSIRVVERDQIQRILDEQKLGASGAVDPATIVRVGKLLNAKYMITGAYITDPKKQMTVTIKAFDTETSQIIYVDGSTTGPTSQLMTLITRAATTANQKLNLPQLAPGSPAARETAAKTETTKKMPLAAALLYSKAIEAQDSGKLAEARTLYSQVVDKFPDYEPAKTALTKLGK